MKRIIRKNGRIMSEQYFFASRLNLVRLFVALLFCMFLQRTEAAAVRLAVDFDTNVTFYLSNGSVKTFQVRRNTSFVYDAFFADGPSVGINKIRWEGNDEAIYESILDLKPGDGVYAFHITSQNKLVDPDPFASYRNKSVYKVPRR